MPLRILAQHKVTQEQKKTQVAIAVNKVQGRNKAVRHAEITTERGSAQVCKHGPHSVFSTPVPPCE